MAKTSKNDSQSRREQRRLQHQDLSRSQSDRVQKMTDDTISEVDRLLGEKEKEIMQV